MAKKALEEAVGKEGFGAKVAGWDKVFQFKPTDGSPFYLHVKDGEFKLEKGEASNPVATIVMSSEDMGELLSRRLNPVTALFSGKLKVEGSLMEAQALAGILS